MSTSVYLGPRSVKLLPSGEDGASPNRTSMRDQVHAIVLWSSHGGCAMRLQVQGKWTEAVASLAHEAAMALSPPALAAHGVNDPRFYVKVVPPPPPPPPRARALQ